MKKFFTLLLLALIIIFSSSAVNSQNLLWKAPQFYYVKDREPYESPVKTTLVANTKVELYDKPAVDGVKVIGTVQEGETVERISCLVLTNPLTHSVKILRTIKAYSSADGEEDLTLQAGDYVYLLMYTGEGTFLGLYQGKEAWWLDMNIKNFLSKADMPTAWGKYEGATTDQNLSVITWDCIRKVDGTVGWALVQMNGEFLNNFDIAGSPF